MTEGTERNPAPRRALLFALVALLLCLQGARGLYDPDEGRYAAIAAQMVASGDWFTPRIADHVPHFTKPPLTYWLLASGMTLFGRNEWGVRLPIGACGILTVVLAYALARRLVPADPLLAATVQATSLLPYAGAHVASTDPLLTLCETLAVFGFVAAWWRDPALGPAAHSWGARWGPAMMWLGFGLAFLTKGPPGLLPLLPISTFVVWSRGPRALGKLASPLGLALFALVGLGWFALQLRARPDLIPYWLGAEVEGRLLGLQHRNPGWHGLLRAYAPLVLLGSLPWGAVALVEALRGRRRAAAKRGAAHDATREAMRFLWLWLALPFLTFCMVRSRQPLYLLPLTVPASLLLARALSRTWRWTPRVRGWLAAWVVVLLVLTAVSAVLRTERDGRRFAAELAPLLDELPRAVVFVDILPRYSPVVYFGCPVRNVELLNDLVGREGKAYRPLAEPLSTILPRRERGMVWLVPHWVEGSWRLAFARAGWAVRRLGTVEELEVFAAEPARAGPSRSKG